ncbi:hypothetical protein Tco_0819965 [Tanacetum coccineum]|uniref:Reverse transcriptase domain-containing protein n=1 Tax=Tanacetum coccineum TaxID=301880 RepID=A0ABQ5A8Y4_9ASTR
MKDEFYHLTVKGNDLKTYVRRFQELATLCPTMVPDSKKMMEVFIGGLPRKELSTTTTTATIITTTITLTPTTATIITNHNRTKGKNLSELMLPLQLRTIGGPFNQELQKQGANHWKKSATSDSYLSYMWRERTLCKSVMKDHQQQCPGESLHAKG